MVAVLASLMVALLSFVIYLALTAGSGDLILWSAPELITGAILAAIVGLLAGKVFVKRDFRMANPLRWGLAVVYFIGPFLWGMTKANFDVAYRVITGKIRPGIVKISPDLKTDFGLTFFANSITLTPGTLSVDVNEKNNDLYVHWINVTKEKPTSEDIAGSFEKWARRIAE